MRNRLFLSLLIGCTSLCLILLHACSKGSDSGGSETPPPTCAGVTITVSAAATETDPGASTDTITVSAPSGSGFTFKLNNGNYQSSASFNNLPKGSYTITVKNAAGCTGTTSVTLNEKTCTGTAGPKFLDVKAIVQSKCAISGCHVTPAPTGNLNLQIDCNIVFQKDKIFNRTVTIGDMPQTGPLTPAEKQKITDWINAGGRLTD